MLRNVKDMIGFAIEATDGALGHVRDFYFDDEAWVIRYLVIETGSWLSNRKVLISPYSMGEPNWSSEQLPVRLTRDQVRASPSIDTDKPVSRQNELDFSGYYGYPNYWGSTGLWGTGYYPGTMYPGAGGRVSERLTEPDNRKRAQHSAGQRGNDDPHLRSCNAVIRYHIHAEDGDIGHVQGMLVDEKTWA
ncbi:MAG: PRC-barrel domain containing protein, partial [Proteobacteria bacterium]|nr:PRC-barrel domain containing protein [Pseudomonadota bacterium]